MHKITNAFLTFICLSGLFVLSFTTEGWSRSTATNNNDGKSYVVDDLNQFNADLWMILSDNTFGVHHVWDGVSDHTNANQSAYSELETAVGEYAYALMFCDGAYLPSTPSAGNGSSGDPYQISSFENLLWISESSARWNHHYLQTQNINASATSEACFDSGAGWSPIGNGTDQFTGSYDGGGFTISNLYVNRPSDRYAGLFGRTSEATIQNLYLTGSIISDWDAGALVGYAHGANGLISNVHADVEMTVRESGGGLVGHNQGTIENCSAHGNVLGSEMNFGGLVAYNNGGKIYSSYATGDISTSHAERGQVGGLVGAMLNAGAEIENCYATGNISAQANSDNGGVGGLIGRIRNTNPVISNSYSYGSVSADGGPIGGLVGHNADGSESNVSDSFWDTQTSGTGSSAGGTGLTTANMKLMSNFIAAGWDFQCESNNGTEDFWGRNSIDNDGYPFLSWQGFVHDAAVEAGVVSDDQGVCPGGTFQTLSLTGSNGSVQWQVSDDNALFADIVGATSDTLNIQSMEIDENTWFRAVVTEGTCSDTTNVVLVEILEPTTSSIEVTACNSYLAPDGQEYGESGIYIAVIPNATGCDSTITIDLTVNADIEVNISVAACESYTAPDEAIYTTSGQYLAVLPRSNDCDSLITIDLTIHEPTMSTINPESCNTYTAPDGQVYVASGQYQAVIPNSAGCDSTITINLTITESTLDLSYTSQDATPGFANGSATIVASGGTAPYTYQWNDAFMQTTETMWGVFPGTYVCTVTDDAGCSMSLSVFVDLFTGVPTTNLHANHCNTVGFDFGSIVSASTVQNANAYRWEFVEQGGNALPEYTRYQANPHILLHWITGISLGTVYDIRVKARVGEVWAEYGTVCTITTVTDVPLTEVLPQYTPTNAQANQYAMCNVSSASTVNGAENYEWEFDNGVDPAVYYVRGAGNPSVKLSWVDCLKPGNVYAVRVRANVGGQWGSFGAAHPISMAPTATTQLRPNLCGGTFHLNNWLFPTNVCISSSFEWELVNTVTSEVHIITTTNAVGAARPAWAVPALVPGAEYSVRVKATQCGEEGDFSSACNITIAGPQAQGDETPALRTMAENSATLYPNPNAGTEVRVELNGLGDGNHEVMIQIYDIYGKLIQNEGFGHAGSAMSRLVRFDGNMAMGMYMVQIVVDGERFATERLVIK